LYLMGVFLSTRTPHTPSRGKKRFRVVGKRSSIKGKGIRTRGQGFRELPTTLARSFAGTVARKIN